MTVGKGVGGGFPLSAVISTDDLTSRKPWSNPSASSSSYGGNPLAAAAGLAALEIILKEDLVKNADRVGAVMLTRLEAMKEKYRCVGEVRGPRPDAGHGAGQGPPHQGAARQGRDAGALQGVPQARARRDDVFADGAHQPAADHPRRDRAQRARHPRRGPGDDSQGATGSSSMLRGAVIGLGNVAIHGHLPGWLGRPDVRIVAAADSRPAQRAECEARLPGARWYDSPEDLLAGEPLDFVDISTPPSSHAPLILSALDRGLHVLCEKPLVSSPAESAKRLPRGPLGRPCAAHRAQLAPRAHPLADRRPHPRGRDRSGAAHCLGDAAGETGSRAAVSTGGWTPRWPAAASSPTTAGTSSTSCRPGSARGRGASARGSRRGATRPSPSRTRPRCGSSSRDASAEILLTWAAEERRNRVEVDGTEGRIELRDDTLVLTGKGGERRWPGLPALSDGSHHPDWFHKVAGRFLAAVAGEAPRGANLAEAALCCEIEHLARESSRRGGVQIPLSPAPSGHGSGAL